METFSGGMSQAGEFDPLFLYLRIPLIWEILSILEILIQITRDGWAHEPAHNRRRRALKARLPNHDGNADVHILPSVNSAFRHNTFSGANLCIRLQKEKST